MLQIQPLDPGFPVMRQLELEASPVVLLNTFTVAAGDIAALVAAWESDANWMKTQPGYISAQLHRAIGESCVFFNYAVWQSLTHFRAAFSHPDFKNSLGAYPDSASATPHLFQKVAINNICTQ